jgi:hypothetical protein
MGRPQSPETFQSVVNDWRRRLFAVAWGTNGAAGEAQALALVIGLESTGFGPEQHKRLRAATKALHSAVVEANGNADSSARPDALDRWICRYLVNQGADLLVPDKLRRAALAHQRDARRRRVHAERGLRSARIEMSEAIWQKLEAVQAALEVAGHRKVTLGMALEHIVSAHDARMKKTKSSKVAVPVQRPSANVGDLFAELETASRSQDQEDRR